MLHLAQRRSRKPYHLLCVDRRRRLQKLERAARLQNKCLQEQNSDGISDNLADVNEASVERNQDELNKLLNASEVFSDNSFICNGADADSSCSESAASIESGNYLDDIESPDTADNLEKQLAEAFVSCNMSHIQGNAILRVLRSHSCFSTFPKDCRTLLKTPRIPQPTFNVAGGEYLHLGFEEGLLAILRRTDSRLIPQDGLMIDFSTDGATLDEQGKIQIWPIQVRIANIPRSKPEIVGIWRGSSKPTSAQELLGFFVNDVRDVANRGILFDNQVKTIKIRCFLADAPARAFVLGHKNHGSTFPCSKCWVRGDWIRRGVMAYRGIQHRPRTDEEYAMRVDGEHHSDVDSVLLDLEMGLVTQTIFDSMHIAFLGVVPKINSSLVDGKFNPRLKLSPRSLQNLTMRMQLISHYCPTEFSRKPQLMKKYSRFKATENCQILLYTAPAAYYGLMFPAAYTHFLLLHCAIRILVSSSLSQRHCDSAQTILEIFVNRAEDVYGPEFLSYVTHCLLHLVDDVRRFGPLGQISMFPYENNMMYFRTACRKPHLHLQQIVNRRFESSHVSPKIVNAPNSVLRSSKPWVCPSIENPPAGSRQFQNLDTGLFRLTVKDQDNTVILQNSRVCVIQSIILWNNHYHLAVKEFNRVEDLYDVGLPSSAVGVYRCCLLSGEISLIDINEVQGKGFRMPYWYSDGHIDPIVDMNSAKNIAEEAGRALKLLRNDISAFRRDRDSTDRNMTSTPSTSRQSKKRKLEQTNVHPTQLPLPGPSSLSSSKFTDRMYQKPSLSTFPDGQSTPLTPNERNEISKPKTHTPRVKKIETQNIQNIHSTQNTQNIHSTSNLPRIKQNASVSQPSITKNLTLKKSPAQPAPRRLLSSHELEKELTVPGRKTPSNSFTDQHPVLGYLRSIKLQLNGIEERQIQMENKINENARAIQQLVEASIGRRTAGERVPICFRTINDFLEFEDVNEEIYNNVVGYFVYLGRTNPTDCAAEYFRAVFPEDEEVSPHLSLHGRHKGPNHQKLRGSRFARACQDAMNLNKHFPRPHVDEVHLALEKALKSLKTKKWRYNKRTEQNALNETEPEEEIPPTRRRRIDHSIQKPINNINSVDDVAGDDEGDVEGDDGGDVEDNGGDVDGDYGGDFGGDLEENVAAIDMESFSHGDETQNIDVLDDVDNVLMDDSPYLMQIYDESGAPVFEHDI